MTTTFRATRRLIGLIAITAVVVMPQFAAAATGSVITKQILPVNGTSCTPIFLSEVTTYIYDGELHSFDIVVSDPTYVGLAASAGDVTIPFNYITRRIDADGKLRLHVDTTAAIDGRISVSVIMLSASGGDKTCLTTVSFVTDGEGSITTDSPVVTDNTPSTPVNAGGSGTGGTGASQPTGKTIGTSTSNPPTVAPASSTSNIANLIAKACTKSGASQLWFILIAIFFVIVAFVGLSQPPIVLRHVALPVVLIGVPLLLLLAFWLWVTSCRLSVLIPIILIVAAAIGLYAAYRSSPLMQPVIELPASKTKKSETADKK